MPPVPRQEQGSAGLARRGSEVTAMRASRSAQAIKRLTPSLLSDLLIRETIDVVLYLLNKSWSGIALQNCCVVKKDRQEFVDLAFFVGQTVNA